MVLGVPSFVISLKSQRLSVLAWFIRRMDSVHALMIARRLCIPRHYLQAFFERRLAFRRKSPPSLDSGINTNLLNYRCVQSWCSNDLILLFCKGHAMHSSWKYVVSGKLTCWSGLRTLSALWATRCSQVRLRSWLVIHESIWRIAHAVRQAYIGLLFPSKLPCNSTSRAIFVQLCHCMTQHAWRKVTVSTLLLERIASNTNERITLNILWWQHEFSFVLGKFSLSFAEKPLIAFPFDIYGSGIVTPEGSVLLMSV